MPTSFVIAVINASFEPGIYGLAEQWGDVLNGIYPFLATASSNGLSSTLEFTKGPAMNHLSLIKSIVESPLLEQYMIGAACDSVKN
jgi:hypothetical protein